MIRGVKGNLRSSRKAQAALEFMTTYGWALMAIIVAIGALSYFDFLSADKYVSTSCSTGSQIQCLEATVSSTGTLQLKLRNNYPVDIAITQLSLRKEGDTYDNVATYSGATRDFPRGSSRIFTVSLMNRPQKGKKFNFDITINFNRNSPGANSYQIKGSAVIKVI